MNAKIVTARVSADGVLRLEVPMGTHLAGCEVDVAVAQHKVPETEDEKRAVMQGLVGAWQGEFTYIDPSESELRDCT